MTVNGFESTYIGACVAYTVPGTSLTGCVSADVVCVDYDRRGFNGREQQQQQHGNCWFNLLQNVRFSGPLTAAANTFSARRYA